MIPDWVAGSPGVVLASRARLARNLENIPFRGVLPPQAAREFREHFGRILSESTGLLPFADETGEELVLLADHLRVPADLLDTGSPWGALEADGRGAILLQSDHFRLWAIRPGLDPAGALEDLAGLEPAIAAAGTLAKDPDWGWRTASPEDVGTGLRSSVLLYAPALWLTRRVSNLSDGLEVLGGKLASPWHQEDPGPLLVVSNRRTLGRTELEIVADVERWSARVRDEEERAANDLVEHWGSDLRDSVHRSEAILGSARLISVGELVQRVALAALGARLGWLPNSRGRDALELLLGTRDGTLRSRRAQELPEAHPQLDDLRAAETRNLWNRPIP